MALQRKHLIRVRNRVKTQGLSLTDQEIGHEKAYGLLSFLVLKDNCQVFGFNCSLVRGLTKPGATHGITKINTFLKYLQAESLHLNRNPKFKLCKGLNWILLFK